MALLGLIAMEIGDLSLEGTVGLALIGDLFLDRLGLAGYGLAVMGLSTFFSAITG